MEREWGNEGKGEEMERKWGNVESQSLSISSSFPHSPFPLNFLILSPFPRSPAARLQRVVTPCCLHSKQLQSITLYTFHVFQLEDLSKSVSSLYDKLLKLCSTVGRLVWITLQGRAGLELGWLLTILLLLKLMTTPPDSCLLLMYTSCCLIVR